MVWGQRGKEAVQFHFLHPLLTQLHAFPLGMMVDIGCTFGVALGCLLLKIHAGSPCQGQGDRALPSCSDIGGEGVRLNT